MLERDGGKEECVGYVGEFKEKTDRQEDMKRQTGRHTKTALNRLTDRQVAR